MRCARPIPPSRKSFDNRKSCVRVGGGPLATVAVMTAVDVVLPVLNEAVPLPWVLDRLPEGFRPIVVDNGSTDGSGDLARHLGATVIDQPRRAAAAAPRRRAPH